MSQALPGTHLCKAHQGNHSHYAQENCELCRAQVEIERLRNDLADALDMRRGDGPTALSWLAAENQRLRERDERMDERVERMQKRLDLANTESFYQKIEIARLRSDLETAERALDAQTDFRAEIERLKAWKDQARYWENQSDDLRKENSWLHAEIERLRETMQKILGWRETDLPEGNRCAKAIEYIEEVARAYLNTEAPHE